MSTDNLSRLIDVVGAAADMEPGAARSWLAEQLSGEPKLLAEAQTLLEAGTREDKFLEGKPETNGPEGMSIGGYRLGRLLGEGGMGSVYLAEQEQPRRQVALKVLSLALATPRAMERFQFEAQALAALRHPAIAHIYETGIHAVDAGPVRRELPWFAMEYVEGARSILAHCQEEGLSRSARLDLFARICDAVQHGHQKGVLHRDLKPDNILVDKDGRPKVIDFGVARIIDDEAILTTLNSHASELAGTLPYMAPERIAGLEGADDVRGDVYALGVVLYQLLTDALPIEMSGTDVLTAARRAAEQPPRKPSEIVGTLKGDLEAILLMALEKDPARRYPSADALARDVRRFLESRPIEARTPGTLYQLRLLAKRRMPLVLALGAVLVVSIAAATISMLYAVKSNRAEQEAQEGRKRADLLFETHLERSLDTVAHLVPHIARLANGKEVARQLVERLHDDLATLEPLTQGDPRARFLMGTAHLILGNVLGGGRYAALKRHDDAEHHYRRALEILTALEAEGHPEADLRVLLRAQHSLCLLLSFRGRHEEAGALQLQAASRVAQLPEGEAGTQRLRAMLAGTRATLALRTHDWQAAIESAQEAIRAHERADPSTKDYNSHTSHVWAYDTWGNALRGLGDSKAAFTAFESGLDLANACTPKPDEVYIHQITLFRLGAAAAVLAAENGDFEAQQRHGARAVEVLKSLLVGAPNDATCIPRAVMLLISLAGGEEMRSKAATAPEDKRAALLRAKTILNDGIEILTGPRKRANGRWIKFFEGRIAAVDGQLEALDK